MPLLQQGKNPFSKVTKLTVINRRHRRGILESGSLDNFLLNNISISYLQYVYKHCEIISGNKIYKWKGKYEAMFHPISHTSVML